MPGPDLPYIVLDQRAFPEGGSEREGCRGRSGGAVAGGRGQRWTPHRIAGRRRSARSTGCRRRRRWRASIRGWNWRIGQLPPSEWGRLLAHSYAEHGNWFVMLVLGAYQMEGPARLAGTTHFSPWSYDRHVPLAFYGEPFVPGEYHERVAPVDLAATFASLAGVNQPSAAVGHVLTVAIKPTHPAKQYAWASYAMNPLLLKTAAQMISLALLAGLLGRVHPQWNRRRKPAPHTSGILPFLKRACSRNCVRDGS